MSTLLNDQNEWVSNSNHRMDLFVTHFKNTFQIKDSIPLRSDLIDLHSYKSTQSTLACLADIPSLEEISKALFSMGPYKSPNPDGFYQIFFQKAWDLIGPHIVNFI